MKIFLLLGSLNAFLSVALGAFGAHALKAKLTPDKLDVYQTGVHYHMIHAIALILIAVLSDKLTNSSALVNASGWAIFIGIILFSGSLYALSLTGLKIFGPITPLGGVSFLVGWILLAIAAMK
ncbi:hypothetical protein BC351_13180 [Paenibacillus ferrarius]|uniref:DUF423 domain-containing protein n=1 Tax=Paenibacillus ferrarius TaxID=1469647 RepID=A0A1V4H782_9BACL|nr:MULTISPECIES: DUF423 domain-containing protein [Paenibacillus]NQX67447.1 DUF423 domain-containing protein [Paenibacillus alba]OPH46984.1 hypothetical protein BC351_13180 [Paenibacillus ferrarius]